MRILGVDVGTNTGVALVTDGEVTHYLAITCSYPDYVQRAVKLSDDMVSFWSRHGGTPDLAMIEGYAYGQTKTLVTMATLGTICRLWCHIHSVPYLEVQPTALKKFITGKGNAKKEDMKLHLYKRFGLEARTSDEVDALGLSLMGAYLVGDREGGLPALCLEPVDKIRASPEWRELMSKEFDKTPRSVLES